MDLQILGVASGVAATVGGLIVWAVRALIRQELRDGSSIPAGDRLQRIETKQDRTLRLLATHRHRDDDGGVYAPIDDEPRR
jgi:hypothetical protein